MTPDGHINYPLDTSRTQRTRFDNNSGASQTWLNDVANLMNNRPRKTLGWRTPAEAMADKIATFKSTVELDV